MDDIYNLNRKCTYCGEKIDENVGRCSYCGSLTDKNIENDKEKNESDSSIRDNEATIQENEQPVNSSFQKGWYPSQLAHEKNQLSNGLKVFLTILSVVVPFLGQLAGIIIAIVYMNTSDDQDKRSFGIALLIASLVFFILSFMACVIIGMAAVFINGVY